MDQVRSQIAVASAQELIEVGNAQSMSGSCPVVEVHCLLRFCFLSKLCRKWPTNVSGNVSAPLEQN